LPRRVIAQGELVFVMFRHFQILYVEFGCHVDNPRMCLRSTLLVVRCTAIGGLWEEVQIPAP
jgi:hypothetical protein